MAVSSKESHVCINNNCYNKSLLYLVSFISFIAITVIIIAIILFTENEDSIFIDIFTIILCMFENQNNVLRYLIDFISRFYERQKFHQFHERFFFLILR